MTYWIVLFEKPESMDYKGPHKMKIAQVKFDRLCDPDVNLIQVGGSVYKIEGKKVFSIEQPGGEASGTPIHAFIVCEGHKLKQP